MNLINKNTIKQNMLLIFAATAPPPSFFFFFNQKSRFDFLKSSCQLAKCLMRLPMGFLALAVAVPRRVTLKNNKKAEIQN